MQRMLSVVATLIVALVSPFAVATKTVAQVKVSQLSYRDRTLPNGLRVLSVEDHSSPTVAIQVWYKVGSKDDP